MESKRNRYSMRAFICSIVSIVPAAILAYVAPVFPARPATASSGCLDNLAAGILFPYFAGLVAVTMLLGITGVVSAIIAIREREPRDKTFAVVAIILGIEIVIATGGLRLLLITMVTMIW